MKTRILLATVAFFALGFTERALAQANFVNFNHLPELAFAPAGFDDNDNTQIVLDGRFPDTCYKVGPTKAKVDTENHKIIIESQTTFYTDEVCYRMFVPYTKVVDLGVVPKGIYEVVLMSKGGDPYVMGLITVDHSTSVGPDDYLYANVHEAFVDNLALTGEHNLVLRGTYTNDCTVVSDVRVATNPANVIVVQPIMTVTAQNCQKIEKAFELKTSLKAVPEGKVLIHVRALNGQAINKVVKFE